MVPQFDLEVYEGDTSVFTYQYKDFNKQPIDITNLEIRGQARRGSEVINFIVTRFQPQQGIFYIEVPQTDIVGKVPEEGLEFKYDIQVKYNQLVRTLVAGTMRVTKQVTV